MRKIFIYTAIALVAAAIGCEPLSMTNGTTQTTQKTPEVAQANNMKTVDQQFDLKTEFKKNAQGLIVSYKITNNSGKNVFLLNRVPVRNKSFNYGAENYYLLPDDGETIQISKQALFMDKDSTATSAVAYDPAATRLNAGQTFEESFQVSQPFAIIHPYEQAAKIKPLPTSPKGVRFCLAVVADDNQKVREEQIGNEKIIRLNAATLQKQQLLCGDVNSTVLTK